MICKCGGVTTDSNHEVKTIKVAKEWFLDATEDLLPLSIDSKHCQGCGRFSFLVFDKDENEVKRHN